MLNLLLLFFKHFLKFFEVLKTFKNRSWGGGGFLPKIGPCQASATTHGGLWDINRVISDLEMPIIS